MKRAAAAALLLGIYYAFTAALFVALLPKILWDELVARIPSTGEKS